MKIEPHVIKVRDLVARYRNDDEEGVVAFGGKLDVRPKYQREFIYSDAEQKAVILLSGLMFLAAFIAAGLNFRFGWWVLPAWMTWASAVVFLLAYALYAEVLRENVWLSRTVEVQEDQKVIDTGLYGLVRHPMYMTTLLLFLSMPLVLGSAISFVITLAYIPIIAKRIRNEEEVLERGLAGYKEYKKRVRYKVIPFVW